MAPDSHLPGGGIPYWHVGYNVAQHRALCAICLGSEQRTTSLNTTNISLPHASPKPCPLQQQQQTRYLSPAVISQEVRGYANKLQGKDTMLERLQQQLLVNSEHNLRLATLLQESIGTAEILQLKGCETETLCVAAQQTMVGLHRQVQEAQVLEASVVEWKEKVVAAEEEIQIRTDSHQRTMDEALRQLTVKLATCEQALEQKNMQMVEVMNVSSEHMQQTEELERQLFEATRAMAELERQLQV